MDQNSSSINESSSVITSEEACKFDETPPELQKQEIAIEEQLSKVENVLEKNKKIKIQFFINWIFLFVEEENRRANDSIL